jgi:hypothetical protein
MSKKLFFATIILLIIVVALAIFMLRPQTPATDVPAPGTSFPLGSELSPTIPPTESFSLPLQQGSVEVTNFLEAYDIYSDPKNTGYYQLGHSPSDTTTNELYSIQYIAQTGFFNVTLLKQPLALARTQAEMDIKNRLQINEETMCTLRYSVAVPAYVDQGFSGRELGFSFCPGSVNLDQ